MPAPSRASLAPLDIDIIAEIDEPRVAALVSALSSTFYVDERAVLGAVRTQGIVNVIHQDTPLKVDIHVAGGTPLDLQQLQRRTPVEVGAGRILYVHPPEDILLQKLRWYRGGETSDRQ